MAHYDTIIRGGMIVDGQRNSRFVGDVGNLFVDINMDYAVVERLERRADLVRVAIPVDRRAREGQEERPGAAGGERGDRIEGVRQVAPVGHPRVRQQQQVHGGRSGPERRCGPV